MAGVEALREEAVSAGRLMERLTGEAAITPFLSASLTSTVAKRVAAGLPIREHELPGRFIMSLTDDERAVLADLKSDDIQCRDDVARIYAEWGK